MSIYAMKTLVPLEYNKYYHIYNRGINSCALFRKHENYEYFLKLYEHHIDPIAETFAWCLLRNHFHFIVRIKNNTENISLKAILPSQTFSNFFNAYTKAYNKSHNRHGALFERPFKRKEIDNTDYLKNSIAYVHNNPVHHNLCKCPTAYSWSSYKTILSTTKTKLKREMVLELFGGIENFKYIHQLKNQILSIDGI